MKRKRSDVLGDQWGDESQDNHIVAESLPDSLGSPFDELRYYAEMFLDVQEFRKSMANKVRSGTVDSLVALGLEKYKESEEMFSKALVKCFRRTASQGILVWQKAEPGIGEHLLARLLGSIGTPRIAVPKHWEGTGKDTRILVAEEPRQRLVSELWSYCGHGDPERKLRKTMTAEEVLAVGNKRIKAIVWNIACACLKAGIRSSNAVGIPDTSSNRFAISHYGEVYLKRRSITQERLHAARCVRCGPAGKPALEGSPWTKAHQHADGLRIVGKEVLRDLWIAAGTRKGAEGRFFRGFREPPGPSARPDCSTAISDLQLP